MKLDSILVTGANGFVGRALCEELVKLKFYVKATSRNKFNPSFTGCEVFQVPDINANTDWTKALDNVNTVIHLAARVHIMNDLSVNPLEDFLKVNLHGTINLANQAADAGVKRFIYISSIKVNGESTKPGMPFTEADIPNPTDAYAISKYEAEQELVKIAEQVGMEFVIIRPPLVYGPGVKANFAQMLKIIQRKIPLPFGEVCNKRSFVYIGNLVDLIVRCIKHPAAANQIFLVSDGHDLSTKELLQKCAIALNLKIKLIPIPLFMLRFLANSFRKKEMMQRLCDNLQVDISKARRILNWTPPIPVQNGLEITVKEYLELN